MKVVCNGKELELGTRPTVSQLLDELGLRAPYALVELNGEPVERERYAETALQEGDTVVVARPVAGG
ncbi:MAG TPA: sulfur carrier protein ThiS [Gaiellaceae bacterium]|nr:sulfur carrier protein ThiS [Gaiellaceae bacterium]